MKKILILIVILISLCNFNIFAKGKTEKNCYLILDCSEEENLELIYDLIIWNKIGKYYFIFKRIILSSPNTWWPDMMGKSGSNGVSRMTISRSVLLVLEWQKKRFWGTFPSLKAQES